MKAAIYSRFSTDRQTDSSIDDQERVCGEYAGHLGWAVVERYRDEGISGAAIGNRPGFLRMREAAMGSRFDVLLVTDTTRIARSQELAPLIDRLRYQGVRVIGVQDAFDSVSGTADMQAGLSGIMSVEFRRMVRARTHAALESRAKQRRPTGGRAYGYDNAGQIVEEQAIVVREIFGRAAEGASCRTIATELNRRGVPSPGSAWKRVERRCGGWMGSGVRTMLINERYTGRIAWNRSQWVKDPDSGKRIRRERPQSEWVAHTDDSQRIVSDGLWSAVQRRMRPMPDDSKLKAGGRAKYLLSGLLRCDCCRAHYVIADARSYVCSSYINGAACSNGVRVRRDRAEQVLIGDIDGLLAPARVERMAVEMDRYFRERLRERAARTVEAPQELRELDARIARLRDRLERGDPDLAADELQAAIDRALEKRRELEAAQPSAKVSFRLLERLPAAAQLYRQQIAKARAGDARSVDKAKVVLRRLFGGEIRLEPQSNGGLIAHWNQHPAAILQGAGTFGSGGRI